MFASGKRDWYFSFLLLSTITLFYTLINLGYDRHVFSNAKGRSPESRVGVLSPETIAALNEDAQLRSALLSMTEQLAQTSNEFGERFGVASVQRFGMDLANNMVELRKREDVEPQSKRGLIDDLGKAFQGLVGGGKGGQGGPGGFNLTGALSGALDGVLGKIGGSITGGLTTPALFLGIGVGMGASNGLNLSDMATINDQATKIATAFNSSATGVNLIARNLGSGVAGQLTSVLNLTGTGNIQFGSVAFALASGIGNATSKGLKLTNQEFLPLNDSSAEAIAGNLGLGITTPIVSNIDIKSLISNVGGGGVGASVMQMLPQIAAAAGTGLGEGVKNGLGFAAPAGPAPKLGKRQQPSNPLDGVDVPKAVNEFTKGLSQSVLTGVDIKSLGDKFNITGGIGNMIDIQAMLPGLAAGAGSGIGLGISVGLNYKSANATPLVVQGAGMSSDNAQAATIAELFTQNLVSNFLLNSTAITDLGSTLSSNQPTLLKDFKLAKAAEGFARGTVEGVSTALSSVGGLQNLISGNYSSNAIMNVPALEPTTFDDSLNGSAVSFARGLLGEGSILVADIFKRMRQDANNTGPQSPQKRDIDAKHTALAVRQAPEDMMSPFPDLVISEGTVMTAVQIAVDTLHCKGIGGVASIGLGILTGGKDGASLTDLAKSQVPLDPKVTQALPQGPVEIKSDGNTFTIVLRDADIRINGLRIVPFGVLTALHILFMSIAFLLALPLYLILGVMWRLCMLAGHPVNEEKNKRWRMILLGVFFLFALVGIILGIIGMGNSQHFRDPHGVFGLIALLLIFPTVITSVMRLRTQVEYPSSAYFVGVKAPFALFKSKQRIFIISGILTQLLLSLGQIIITNGFATLRSISLCVADAILSSDIVFGVAGVLLMIQIGATGLVAIRAWLEQHIAKRQAAGEQSMVFIEKGEISLKGSIETSSIERKRKPAFLNMKLPSFPKSQREQGNLAGSPDSKIGTPFNVKKEGAEEDFSPSRARGVTENPGENPFLSPAEQADRNNRRTYNPKTGGYEYQYTSAIDDNDYLYDIPGGNKAQLESSGRPSSELFTGPSLQPTKPKTENVTVADLFPAPSPRPDEIPKLDEIPIQLTAKSRTSSFSRPFAKLDGDDKKI